MDNFMEQPTYKMNRGAILAQGLRSLAPTAGQMWEGATLCRSELAREKLTGAAFIQEARVIVDVFREQARSYKKTFGQAPPTFEP
ncbi:hypothetical protein ASD70_08140 [Pseudomonas sp. Root569]|nr:hypothetical protein ASD70_08140 [Pseudomonas sp. Root569]